MLYRVGNPWIDLNQADWSKCELTEIPGAVCSYPSQATLLGKSNETSAFLFFPRPVCVLAFRFFLKNP